MDMMFIIIVLGMMGGVDTFLALWGRADVTILLRNARGIEKYFCRLKIFPALRLSYIMSTA